MEVNLGKYVVSSRTIKNLLALGLIIIIMQLIGQENSGSMIASMSALTLLRDGVVPHRAAPGRIIGQAFGALLSLLYFFIYDGTGKKFFIKLIFILFFVLITIICLTIINFESGAFGGVTTFLIIVFMIPDGSALSYCLLRICDSAIGVLVAIIVNSFWLEKNIVKTKIKMEALAEIIKKLKL